MQTTTQGQTSTRSIGSVPRLESSMVASNAFPWPGNGELASTVPYWFTACEMPELHSLKIGTRYSAARIGATRA